MKLLSLDESCNKFYDNCFDVIRFVAAIIVMLSHSFRHFDIAKPEYLLFFTDGSIGVITFFALSGYLTFASYDRLSRKYDLNTALRKYFVNRVFRLYPTFIFVIVVMGIVDCILGGGIDRGYLLNAVKNLVIFEIRPYNNMCLSNGVFWAMRTIILVYILIPVVYKFVIKLSSFQWLVLILVMCHFNLLDSLYIRVFEDVRVFKYFLGRIDGPVFFFYEFLIGMFLYCKRDVILPLLSRKMVMGICWFGFSVWFDLYEFKRVITPFGEMHNVVFGLIVPWLVIGTGYLWVKNLSIDISYAVFCFHMIVVGLVLRYVGNDYKYMVMTWVIVLFASYLYTVFVDIPLNRYLSSKIDSVV